MSQKNYMRQTKKSHNQNYNIDISESTVVQKGELYSGPIPHPDILIKFSEVDSSFPERIFKMAENHADANIEVQKKITNANVKSTYLGQIFTLVLGLAGIATGIFFALKGFEAGAITAIVTGIAPVLIAALTNLKK